MRRVATAVPIGNEYKGRTRYNLRLEDEPDCEQGSALALMRFFALIQAVVDQPALLKCGLNWPEKMSISHNGDCWVLEAMAESEDI
jgi:hypothetical protein